MSDTLSELGLLEEYAREKMTIIDARHFLQEEGEEFTDFSVRELCAWAIGEQSDSVAKIYSAARVNLAKTALALGCAYVTNIQSLGFKPCCDEYKNQIFELAVIGCGLKRKPFPEKGIVTEAV